MWTYKYVQSGFYGLKLASCVAGGDIFDKTENRWGYEDAKNIAMATKPLVHIERSQVTEKAIQSYKSGKSSRELLASGRPMG
jgi:hypothetical protein